MFVNYISFKSESFLSSNSTVSYLGMNVDKVSSSVISVISPMLDPKTCLSGRITSMSEVLMQLMHWDQCYRTVWQSDVLFACYEHLCLKLTCSIILSQAQQTISLLRIFQSFSKTRIRDWSSKVKIRYFPRLFPHLFDRSESHW